MKVSVIVPFFNAAETLRWTIFSVLRQTYQDFELILVDDGSTDVSSHIGQDTAATRFIQRDIEHTLEGWYDTGSNSYPNVKYIRKEQNTGVVEARNLGVYANTNLPTYEMWKQQLPKNQTRIPICTGDALLFLDADDWIDQAFLEKTVPLLTNDVGIVSTDMHVFSDDADSVVQAAVVTLETIKHTNTIPICSLIRREVFSQCGGFPKNTFEDWALWIAILKSGWKIAVLNAPLFHYRHHMKESRITHLIKHQDELLFNMKKLHADIYEK